MVVSGGKQYRVAPGDQILVDRLAAEPGSSVKVGRVLLLHDASGVKVGLPGVEGVEVEARVLAHRRGPRIETIRYKSKKRVRVHRGGRADLTALEILTVAGVGAEVQEKKAKKPEGKPAGARGRGRAAAQASAEPETPAAEAKVEAKVEAADAAGEKPKRARRGRKETE